jgi:hypothetical protein
MVKWIDVKLDPLAAAWRVWPLPSPQPEFTVSETPDTYFQ